MALKPLGAVLAGTLLTGVPASEPKALEPAPASRAAPAAGAPPNDHDALTAALKPAKKCAGNCPNCPLKVMTP